MVSFWCITWPIHHHPLPHTNQASMLSVFTAPHQQDGVQHVVVKRRLLDPSVSPYALSCAVNHVGDGQLVDGNSSRLRQFGQGLSDVIVLYGNSTEVGRVSQSNNTQKTHHVMRVEQPLVETDEIKCLSPEWWCTAKNNVFAIQIKKTKQLKPVKCVSRRCLMRILTSLDICG